MPPDTAPIEGDVACIRRSQVRETPSISGIGIIDLHTGEVYLVVASMLFDGGHASLAKDALGIIDHEAASHLRGFVIGIEGGNWIFANGSGLNPSGNRMEPEIFDAIRSALLPLLGVCP